MKKKLKQTSPRLHNVLRRIDRIIDTCRAGAVEDRRVHHTDGWFTTSLAEFQAMRRELVEAPNTAARIESARRADQWDELFAMMKRATVEHIRFMATRSPSFAMTLMSWFDASGDATVKRMVREMEAQDN